jgi:diaminopimelate decarboxylase
MVLPDRVAGRLAAAARPVCAYVYDTSVLRASAAAVRAALPPGATLLYAVKANGHPAVVRALAEAADGLEVASGGELALAWQADAARVAFGGPAKTDGELRAALRAGVTLHVESAQELRRLAWLSAGGAAAGRVALRVNRAAAGPAGSHAMTGAATPFGIDEAQLPQVVALAGELGVPIAGFHLHAVSNSLDAGAYAGFVLDSVAWSVRAATALGVELRYVNVGGGLGVCYTDPAKSLDLAALDWRGLGSGGPGDWLPPGVELAFEPGRFLAAGGGWYAAEVLDLKYAHGRWFAVLRGGTHHFRLPAAWGYDHPFTVLAVDEWSYPWERPSVEGVEVDAVGELCTPRDVLCRGRHVDRLRVGDVLVFGHVGAYGWDISHHEFLHHPHPEVMVL